MKTLFAKKNLFIRVAIGFVLGVLLGFAAPQFSISTKVVGDIYLNLIKMMIIPIVICAVFCGIANIRDGALLRRIGVRTVLLYVLMFVVSSAVWTRRIWITSWMVMSEVIRAKKLLRNSAKAFRNTCFRQVLNRANTAARTVICLMTSSTPFCEAVSPVST